MPKSLNLDSDMGEVFHEWKFKEYSQHDRGKFWYTSMAVLGVALVVFAVLSSNFLFALVIILFGIILFLQSHQEPMDIQFAITGNGVVVGSKLYSYSEFKNFFIIYQPPEVKTLFFSTTSMVRPQISIPLLNNNPLEIRDTLSAYLVEDLEKEQEPFSEQMGRSWKIH